VTETQDAETLQAETQDVEARNGQGPAALAEVVVEPVYESVLDAVGHTPLIRLARLDAGLPAPVYLKAEFLNPGMSVKDRAALSMVLAAEESGELRQGGVVVEGTSGNTGIGLAIVAAQRGYRCVVVLPDKTSTDKIAVLRAYGAEVVLTPSARPAEHPEQVRNLARSIAERTPGGWLADQYDNPANPRAHVETTGPELWRQTAGRITHFVAGIGTGGTISGTGSYLKEVSDGAVQVIGVDPATSTYGGGDGSPYAVEAIGHYRHPETVEDRWPLSYDRSVADRIERVGDREAIETVHRLARAEGLLVGGSAGAAVVAALRVASEAAPGDVVVVLAPDSGRGYLSKYFNEEWLLAMGFRDGDDARPRVGDLIAGAGAPLVVSSRATVAEARDAFGADGDVDGASAACVALVVLERPSREDGSRSPGDVVGSLPYAALDGLPDDAPITEYVGPILGSVGAGEAPADVLKRLPEDQASVPVLFDGRIVTVVPRADIADLAALAERAEHPVRTERA
jgi:cystathionine beta-synthase